MQLAEVQPKGERQIFDTQSSQPLNFGKCDP